VQRELHCGVNVLKVNLQQSIQVLHARGWSLRRIARELGCHRKTVAGYVAAAKRPISTTGSPEDLSAKVAISTLGSEATADSKVAISTAGSAPGGSVRKVQQKDGSWLVVGC